MEKLTQKQIKAKKKEVAEFSAINVGYWKEVFNHLPTDILIPVIKEYAPLIRGREEWEIENILITECVRNMSYQDFKEIESYFF